MSNEPTASKLLTEKKTEHIAYHVDEIRNTSITDDEIHRLIWEYIPELLVDRVARIEREKKLYGALLDMWDQFGYRSDAPSALRGRYEGGLTALENAREALEEYSDEHTSLLSQ